MAEGTLSLPKTAPVLSKTPFSFFQCPLATALKWNNVSMLIQPQAGYADNLDNHVRDSLITMKKTYRQSFSKGLLEITFRDL